MKGEIKQMDEFKVLLQAVLDSSGIGKSDIAEVQKVLEKYHVNLTADLNKAELLKTIKHVIPELEAELKKITGVDIKINEADLLKAFNQVEKSAQKAVKEEEKLVDTMEKVRAKSEQARQAEEKRQQLAQNNASNKALEEEYRSKEKLVNQMADFREKSEQAINTEGKRQQSAQNNAINKALNDEYNLRQKIAEQSNKIQLSIDDGAYSVQIEKLKSQFQQYGLSVDEAENKVKDLRSTLSTMETSTGEKLVSEFKVLETQIKTTKVQLDQTKLSYDKFAQPASQEKISSTLTKVQNLLSSNTRVTKEVRAEWERYVSVLASGANVSEKEINDIKLRLQETETQMRSMGKLGLSFGDSVKKGIGSLTTWLSATAIVGSVTTTLKKMGSAVYEVDTAMTNLYKVTDETGSKYNQFLDEANDKAQKLGRSVSSLVTQSAEWAKLGFSIDDSANLAEISSIYANVGEVDDATAVSDIVTAMKAFNIEATDSISIIDKLNALGNQYAVSSADLGTGLSNSASSLALAGNSIDQTLAMITAMSEVTQDASESGNAIKILSMRLRGRIHQLPPYEEIYMLCA